MKWIFLILIFPLNAFSENNVTEHNVPQKISQKNFASTSIGHLVTSNTNTLDENQASLGSLYLGYGLTDEWSIGFSPFAFKSFQMINFMSRIGGDINSKSRWAIDIAYYKTIFEKEEPKRLRGFTYDPETDTYSEEYFDDGFHTFKMEAFNIKTTVNHLITKAYRANLTAGYYYYIDDERPFSLRMDPQNNDPYALTLTSLHEFRISKQLYVNYEIGGWGLNYQYPYYHTGLTVGLQKKSLLVSLGASTTFNPHFPKERAKKYAGYDSTGSIHPEFEIQYFF